MFTMRIHHTDVGSPIDNFSSKNIICLEPSYM